MNWSITPTSEYSPAGNPAEFIVGSTTERVLEPSDRTKVEELGVSELREIDAVSPVRSIMVEESSSMSLKLK
jgi:hypothetical protein